MAESTRPTIIFLNGVSSVGKTSIIRTLQDHICGVYLRLGIDTFISMLPPYLFGINTNARPGFLVEQTTTLDGPTAHITAGPVAQNLMLTMYKTVQLFVAQHHNLMIDEVLINQHSLRQYQQSLKNARVYFIGIHAPLKITEQRERDRGNRILGLARSQYDDVHKNKSYDLEIDSSIYNPEDSAEIIISFIKNNPTPTAFFTN